MLNLHGKGHDDDRDAMADSFHKKCYDAPPIHFVADEDDSWEKEWTPAVQVDGFDDPWDNEVGFGA